MYDKNVSLFYFYGRLTYFRTLRKKGEILKGKYELAMILSLSVVRLSRLSPLKEDTGVSHDILFSSIGWSSSTKFYWKRVNKLIKLFGRHWNVGGCWD
jgi:hypothetical protein